MTEKLVIIGNGMAPGRTLEELLESAPDLYEITVFSAEPHVNYNRILLSPVLAGEKTFEEIIIHGDGWYDEQRHHAPQGRQGRRASTARRKTVTSDDGVDRAPTTSCSSPPARPRSSCRCPGHDLPGVITYRDIDDVNAMLLAAQSRGKRRRDRRRPARPRSGQRPRCSAAWTSPSCI